jgi:selenocysteine lyase/cysteine desulfurase
MGAAADYALQVLPLVRGRTDRLAARIREGIRTMPGVRSFDAGLCQCGITTFAVDGVPAGEVERLLRKESVNVSVSPPNATLVDAERRALPPLVRASVHYYNTEEEVVRFLSVLEGVAATARR